MQFLLVFLALLVLIAVIYLAASTPVEESTEIPTADSSVDAGPPDVIENSEGASMTQPGDVPENSDDQAGSE